MMEKHKLTSDQERLLRDQVITDEEPGPVLHDFRVLLEFLGTEGVEAGGKYNLLPLKFIGELDRRLSRPLRLELKRPQIRSHPYLQGLNLLLRASGLSRVEGTGARARLVLDPDMLAQWDRLNPSEQYFNLLEAWLRFGRAEMVGEWGSAWEDLLMPCLQAWLFLPKKGKRYDTKKPHEFYVMGIGRNFYQLALMDLFGLLEVRQPPRPVSPWCPAGVKHTPFGDAALTLIDTAKFRSLLGADLPQEDETEENEDENDGVNEDDEEWSPEVPRFGLWQPLFQPYFPEWRENLTFPAPEIREGEYIFRVSLGKIWRLIAIPAEDTLDDLMGCILRSVKFDDDHLYGFAYRDRLGAKVSALHPLMDEGPWADQIPIGTLPLQPGQAMDLEYDFGDSWRFTVKLERIDPPAARAKGRGKGRSQRKAPRILESHGKAPQQYPNWDE